MGAKDLMATVSGRMPDGEYTIKWQTVGDDGEVTNGEIEFTLKRAAAPSDRATRSASVDF
jgi:methionine-rich copper-binding protein CopC